MPVILGNSRALVQACAQLHRYAACDVPVLIEGETGTGKELAAREVHYASARRDRPFVPVNCGALPDNLIENELFGHERGAYTDAKCAQPGLIDRAAGGTLFLDEVDTLSCKAQITLLRFLENSEYRPVGGGAARVSNARVIAATNRGLDSEVASGKFRSDLQYRLNALYVRLPPLRERHGDVPLLAEHFLDCVARRLGGSPKRWSGEALDALCARAWPGNVRELENVVLRAYMRTDGEVIDAAAIDESVDTSMAGAVENLPEPAAETELHYLSAKHYAIRVFERSYLINLMLRASGNVSAAARLSGTERRQLGKLLKKHGIPARGFRSA